MKIFVTGPSGPPEEFELLREAGHEVVLGRPADQPGRSPYSEAELIEASRDADVIVTSHLETISRQVLEAASWLRLVVVPFIGTERIDVAAATELGIIVANSPTPQNFTGVAEATVGLMLMLLKRVKPNEAKLRRGQWGHRQDQGSLLAGKTVGLVGLGRVGTHVARRLHGWDARLLAVDPYVTREDAHRFNVTLLDLPLLLAESDVVSLHAALTARTRRMMGEQKLHSMKRTAFLVNTARGELVDEAALCRAIEEEWIAGAALDTFEQEPLPASSPLRALDPDRVILTPHNVGHSEVGRQANLKVALESILMALKGEVPAHAVNPHVGSAWRERFRRA